MDSLISTQLTVAMMSSYAIEWLKQRSWFPFAQADESALNRAFSAVVALATSVGLSAVFNRETGTLVVTGLTAGALSHAGWLALQQFVFQHGLYKAVILKPVVAEKVVVTPPDDAKVAEERPGR